MALGMLHISGLGAPKYPHHETDVARCLGSEIWTTLLLISEFGIDLGRELLHCHGDLEAS